MKAKELKILRKKLAKLNKSDFDPLSSFSADKLQVPSNDEISISFARSADVPESRMDEFLALFERNMGDMYKASSWGLDMEEKSAELKHSNACYLLLLGKDESLAGFLHFRFDYDDEEQPTQGVLYVYELQIDQAYRRQGLGKKLMDISEQVASSCELPLVMLTVFKQNMMAMDFYKAIDYKIDDSSPSQHNTPADYEILSKSVGNK